MGGRISKSGAFLRLWPYIASRFTRRVVEMTRLKQMLQYSNDMKNMCRAAVCRNRFGCHPPRKLLCTMTLPLYIQPASDAQVYDGEHRGYDVLYGTEVS